MNISTSRPQMATLIRSTGLVIIGILASTATGFVREAVIAAQFGASRQADIYVIAFQVPQFLFILLSVSLGASMVPVYAHLRLSHGEDAGWAFLRAFSQMLSLALAVLSILAVVLASAYLPFAALGFSANDLQQTAVLTTIMMPAVVITGLSYTVSAALNVHRRFGWAAMASSAYNVAFTLAALGLHHSLSLQALAYGVLFGSLLHLGVQLPELASLIPRAQRSGANRANPWQTTTQAGLKRMMVLGLPIALGYTLHHASIVVDRTMASNLSAGVVAALSYADRLSQVVGQLLGVAVSTAFFPVLAEQASQRDMAGLRHTLQLSLRLIVFAGLPLTLGIVILRQPLVGLLLERGAFTTGAVNLTAGLLGWLVVGMFADALNQPLWRITYAMQSGRTAIWVNGAKTMLRVSLNLALVPLLAAQGIAVSNAVGLAAQLIVLLWVVSQQIGPFLERSLLGLLWRTVAGTTLMGLICVVILQVIARRASLDRPLPQLVALVSCSIAGALVYAGSAWALGIPEALQVQHWLRHRLKQLSREVI